MVVVFLNSSIVLYVVVNSISDVWIYLEVFGKGIDGVVLYIDDFLQIY